MWHMVTALDNVPLGRDLRLAVIDAKGEVHALVFPCRRNGDQWVDAATDRVVQVYPTHWQEWSTS